MGAKSHRRNDEDLAYGYGNFEPNPRMSGSRTYDQGYQRPQDRHIDDWRRHIRYDSPRRSRHMSPEPAVRRHRSEHPAEAPRRSRRASRRDEEYPPAAYDYDEPPRRGRSHREKSKPRPRRHVTPSPDRYGQQNGHSAQYYNHPGAPPPFPDHDEYFDEPLDAPKEKKDKKMNGNLKRTLTNPHIQNAARTALEAGAQAAYSLRHSNGQWLGSKGIQVGTAAIAAAFMDSAMERKSRGRSQSRAGGPRGGRSSSMGGNYLINKATEMAMKKFALGGHGRDQY